MKIGIDARFYGPKQKGLGRYVQKLVENLEKVASQSHSKRSEESWRKTTGSFGFHPQDDKFKYEFVVFLRRENWSEYQPTNPNFRKVLADYPWYSWQEQIFLPFKIWQQKIDLMHFPHFNVPIFYHRPFIITIHDLVLRRFPTRRASTLGPFLYFFKNLAYRLVINSAVKRAKKIIAISNYTKDDILRYFSVDSEKIKVIYEGSPAMSSNLRLQDDGTLGKFNISKPYLLYVGNAYPHKNLERLILAFDRLIQDKQMDLQLVLVGEMDYFYKRLYSGFQSRISSFQKIIFTDFVSDQELAVLYQNASLYVFPSLCEGFGLPPLEAMSFGLSVVSSQESSLPEILGEAAVYFNPLDPNDMAEKIKQFLDDESLQQTLESRGYEQIKKYSWQKMAEETLHVYRNSLY